MGGRKDTTWWLAVTSSERAEERFLIVRVNHRGGENENESGHRDTMVVLGGGQDASAVTTTDHRAGKFEAKFFDKILQEEIGGVKGHFGPINALAFNPDGKRIMDLWAIGNSHARAIKSFEDLWVEDSLYSFQFKRVK
ncbi:unnamed protein product [Ilex paraguariensis]|uniref:Uncharacterized protein n=1 Tax=Ilex paraguariensis TaxID=185542 RepID=A0ABC8T315_9AQUA